MNGSEWRARKPAFGKPACRWKSKALGGTAAFLPGICFPTVLVATCGVFVFPVLFWGARLNPGKGYGLLLLATMGLCAAVVYERVPQPGHLPCKTEAAP